MIDKPRYCYTSGCPLAHVGRGFALDYGDHARAKLCIHLEAPGSSEIAHDLLAPTIKGELWENQAQDSQGELQRRQLWNKARGLGIAEKFLRKGMALVGKSWVTVNLWILVKFGFKRSDLYITNSLRCLPPVNKQGEHYPTGDDRKQAEELCRHYDRIEEFIHSAPEHEALTMISIHPASLSREITPLRLVLEHFKKARDVIRGGGKVIMLMGGKAVKLRLGMFDTVTKTQGHYEYLKEGK
jgi:hypothetical protein